MKVRQALMSMHMYWLGRSEKRSSTLSRPGVEPMVAAFTEPQAQSTKHWATAPAHMAQGLNSNPNPKMLPEQGVLSLSPASLMLQNLWGGGGGEERNVAERKAFSLGNTAVLHIALFNQTKGDKKCLLSCFVSLKSVLLTFCVFLIFFFRMLAVSCFRLFCFTHKIIACECKTNFAQCTATQTNTNKQGLYFLLLLYDGNMEM